MLHASIQITATTVVIAVLEAVASLSRYSDSPELLVSALRGTK